MYLRLLHALNYQIIRASSNCKLSPKNISLFSLSRTQVNVNSGLLASNNIERLDIPYDEGTERLPCASLAVTIGSETTNRPPASKDAPTTTSDSKKKAAAPTPTKEILTDIQTGMSGACPKLGAFYEFFSLANLTPPFQFIRISNDVKQDERQSEDHLLFLEMLTRQIPVISTDHWLRNNKLTTVVDEFISYASRRWIAVLESYVVDVR